MPSNEPKPKIKTIKQLERAPFAPTKPASPKQTQNAIIDRIRELQQNK